MPQVIPFQEMEKKIATTINQIYNMGRDSYGAFYLINPYRISQAKQTINTLFSQYSTLPKECITKKFLENLSSTVNMYTLIFFLETIVTSYQYQLFDESLMKFLERVPQEIPINLRIHNAIEYLFCKTRAEIKQYKSKNPPWNPVFHRSRYGHLANTFGVVGICEQDFGIKFEFSRGREYGTGWGSWRPSSEYETYDVIVKYPSGTRSVDSELDATSLQYVQESQKLVINSVVKHIHGNINEIPFVTQGLAVDALARHFDISLFITCIEQHDAVNKSTLEIAGLRGRVGHLRPPNTKYFWRTPNGRNTADFIYYLQKEFQSDIEKIGIHDFVKAVDFHSESYFVILNKPIVINPGWE